jgi:hypothetical protein
MLPWFSWMGCTHLTNREMSCIRSACVDGSDELRELESLLQHSGASFGVNMDFIHCGSPRNSHRPDRFLSLAGTSFRWKILKTTAGTQAMCAAIIQLSTSSPPSQPSISSQPQHLHRRRLRVPQTALQANCSTAGYFSVTGERVLDGVGEDDRFCSTAAGISSQHGSDCSVYVFPLASSHQLSLLDGLRTVSRLKRAGVILPS